MDTRGGLSTSCWATRLVAISSAKVSTFKAWLIQLMQLSLFLPGVSGSGVCSESWLLCSLTSGAGRGDSLLGLASFFRKGTELNAVGFARHGLFLVFMTL